jgi:hypothetical protein
MEKPLDTMGKVLGFFEERSVWVETFHFHRIEGGEAKLLMHCLVEKDRIPHTRQKLEHMRGVVELQLLENREQNSSVPGAKT